MSMRLYAHPFSSYCQKVLIALYENDLPFEFRMLAPGDGQAAAEHEALWPLKRMPVLVDEGRTVVEASIIVEHLGLHHPGSVRLIPDDPRSALDVRRRLLARPSFARAVEEARPYRRLFPLGAPDRD